MKNMGNSESSLVFSYLSLRKGIGFLGISLPFVLSLGALVIFHTGIQESISSYYYTGMRDVFVGTLCAIGVFLFSYKGYESKDDVAGDLACAFAVGVALFPTAPTGNVSTLAGIIGIVHLVFAASFFLTLAYFSLFLFTKTDPKKIPSAEKLHRNKIYKICGYTMLICILLMMINTLLPEKWKVSLISCDPIYWLESLAIIVFGISWLVKGETILKDKR
jgi:hypothetical protein